MGGLVSLWREYAAVLAEWRGRDEARRRFIEGLVGLVNGWGWGNLEGLANGLHTVCSGLALVFDGVACVEGVVEYKARPGSGAHVPPLEWGLQLHPVLLVPYFPGSSVKGAARAALHAMAEDRGVPERLVRECDSALFGGAADDYNPGAGAIVFLDAYPVGAGDRGLVEADVITPHYYRGGRPVRLEADAQPVPIQGISVAAGARFLFATGYNATRAEERARQQPECCLAELLGELGIHAQAGKCRPEAQAPIAAATLLAYAMKTLGLGGRTLKGYGRLNPERIIVKASHLTME